MNEVYDVLVADGGRLVLGLCEAFGIPDHLLQVRSIPEMYVHVLTEVCMRSFMHTHMFRHVETHKRVCACTR